jgi:hypothetical protein
MLYYIYKITCKNDSNDLYIGSTKDFRKRLNKHKSDCYNENCKHYNYNLYQVIRANGGWQNWAMEIIEDVEVESKDDAEIIEEEYRVKLNANLNTIKCFRSYEEKLEQHRNWYENNREEHLEKSRKWYENNREKVLEKARNWREEHGSKKCECDCGGKYTLQHKTRHERTNKHQNYLNENKILTN